MHLPFWCFRRYESKYPSCSGLQTVTKWLHFATIYLDIASIFFSRRMCDLHIWILIIVVVIIVIIMSCWKMRSERVRLCVRVSVWKRGMVHEWLVNCNIYTFSCVSLSTQVEKHCVLKECLRTFASLRCCKNTNTMNGIFFSLCCPKHALNTKFTKTTSTTQFKHDTLVQHSRSLMQKIFQTDG